MSGTEIRPRGFTFQRGVLPYGTFDVKTSRQDDSVIVLIERTRVPLIRPMVVSSKFRLAIRSRAVSRCDLIDNAIADNVRLNELIS